MRAARSMHSDDGPGLVGRGGGYRRRSEVTSVVVVVWLMRVSGRLVAIRRCCPRSVTGGIGGSRRSVSSDLHRERTRPTVCS